MTSRPEPGKMLSCAAPGKPCSTSWGSATAPEPGLRYSRAPRFSLLSRLTNRDVARSRCQPVRIPARPSLALCELDVLVDLCHRQADPQRRDGNRIVEVCVSPL